MANVKLGDRTFTNTAVVRMNSPDGTVVDFYESNFYDIDVSDLGNIVENNSAFTQYDITEILSKTKFHQILEQRMVPRLLVFRDGGYIDRVDLSRITSTIHTDNTIDWIADGDLGVLGESEYTHFTVEADSDSIFLKCYRSERTVQPEPIAPYYLIDLVTSISRIFNSQITKEPLNYLLNEGEISIQEIVQAIQDNREIRIKFWIANSFYENVTLSRVQIYNKTAKEKEYVLTGFFSNGEKYVSLNFKNTETSATLILGLVMAVGAIYSVNGQYPDEKGDLILEVGATGVVKTINGIAPDEQGNLNLKSLTTVNLSIDWTNGQIVQTFSDNSTRTSTITFDENGVPTKIGDMTLNITGLGSEVGE